MKKYDEALQSYDYAIQKNPEDSIYFFHKANLLTKMKRFEEALEYYDYSI